MRQFIHAASGLIVNVESDEDGNYVAEVVQLPGCVAGAPTFRETMDELDGSIQAVLDVLEHDAHERYMELTEQRSSSPLPESQEVELTRPWNPAWLPAVV